MKARWLACILCAVCATSVPGTAESSGLWGSSGRFDRPQIGFAAPWTQLREGNPEQVGLDAAPIRAALARLKAWTEPQGTARPMFGGAVTLLVHDGVVVTRDATGYALRYADKAGTELPRDQWGPMQADTIFDMASVSKLFTSIVVMQQVEAGRVGLDTPVSRYLPEFAANGKEAITVRQLLVHTSGLPPFLPLWRDWPDKPSRIKAALEAKLQKPPGTAYIYSDLNLIALGVLCERVSGASLDALVRDGITAPLGMRDTGYNPAPEVRHRTAATEYEANPPRGMVRGEVHDENAWSLGGVAGHAGVFSTASDLAVLGQALLNGGSYRGKRILRSSTLDHMLTNQVPQFPSNSHGLGFELDQRWYMDGLSSLRAAGHTGFTGISFVVDFASRSVAILLSNRVHPTRDWGSNNPARRAVAQGLAQALGVRPLEGRDAWFSGVGDERTASLGTPNLSPRGEVHLMFHAFVDTENTDTLTLESSADGGVNWQPVAVRARGEGAPDGAVTQLSGAGHRAWWFVEAEMPASPALQWRWRYVTDKQYSGRGVYLDGIRAWDEGGWLLDGEREPQRLTANGFQRASR